jgi:hypothetical protein
MFVCAALLDFAYARQTIATTNARAFAAANWRALAYSCGCFGWLVAIKVGIWLLPFELSGLYLGTIIGVDKGRGTYSKTDYGVGQPLTSGLGGSGSGSGR